MQFGFLLAVETRKLRTTVLDGVNQPGNPIECCGFGLVVPFSRSVFQYPARIRQRLIAIGTAGALQLVRQVAKLLRVVVGQRSTHGIELLGEPPDELANDWRHVRVVAVLRDENLLLIRGRFLFRHRR